MDEMDDMGGMGGMSMDSGASGMFQPVNKAIARGYWYSITAIVVFLGAVRLAYIWQAYARRRLLQTQPHVVPSRPTRRIARWSAGITATFRELTYSQSWYFSGQVSRYLTPLPIGHWILLVAYLVFVLIGLWSNVILSKDDPMYAYRWEKVGFRAAWVSIMQVPLVYLLSCKVNPISLISGISYERINWLHRWTARTLFLTIIVHWSFFFHEWAMADFVQEELQMMTMVRYGFGAWAVIGWMVLSGFGYFRAKAYELFVLQHIAAAGVLLWLLYKHVPSYAQYNIHLAIAFLAFDWGLRILWNILRNTHVLGKLKQTGIGYSCRLESLPGEVVRLTIQNVDFRWKAGQHVYVCLPIIRPFEMHPFTIANVACGLGGRELILLIQAHRGFSGALLRRAGKSERTGRSHRAFLSGPFGYPPDLSHYETVVFIATSSGASFNTPLLHDLVRNRGCVRRICMHWIIARAEHFSWFKKDLSKLVEQARDNAVSLQITIHVTRSSTDSPLGPSAVSDPECFETIELQTTNPTSSNDSRSSASIVTDEKALLTYAPNLLPPASLRMRHYGRPSVEDMIREPVETAFGETAVVVCGGLQITAQVRSFVAALSDERAVHKGTGAQGIFLFTETYGW